MADWLWGTEAKQLPDGELKAVSEPEGYIPLHCAAKSGSSAMMRWLLDRGAKATDTDAKGRTILHVAAIHNRKQFAEEAVKLAGVEALSSPDMDGNTPLHLAAQAGATDMTTWLLIDIGALSSRNHAGFLPRQLAESMGNVEALQAYDEAVATLKAKHEALMTQQGPLGELLLRQQRLIELQQSRLEKLEERLADQQAMIVHLRTFDARFNQQDHAFRHLGFEQQQFKLLQSLITAQEKSRIEPLLNHVVRGEEKDVEVLIQRDPEILLFRARVADPCERIFQSITAFQYAVWALDWRMWKMMMKYLPKEQAALQSNELAYQGTQHGNQVRQKNIQLLAKHTT